MKGGIECLAAVPLLIHVRIVQAKIGAEIDEFFPGRVAGGRRLLRQSMGQRRKDEIAFFHHGPGRFTGTVAQFPQGGIDHREGFSLERDLADRGDFEIGMTEQEADELDTGVAGRADDAGFDHGYHLSFNHGGSGFDTCGLFRRGGHAICLSGMSTAARETGD